MSYLKTITPSARIMGGTATRSRALFSRFSSSSPLNSSNTESAKKEEEEIEEDEPAFNVEITQEDLDHNKELSEELSHSSGNLRKFTDESSKGFKDLQEKGNKIPEEQERPEDLM